ncbi:MAG: protein-glutamate O-methyltransferase CheR [Deltaproteobacteria bacterium]|nr:protein-glutamate O-methyltransferase CheR [Deltaproteobacteria bacterium]
MNSAARDIRPESENHLPDLLDMVYRERGWDFRNYKSSSISRRISKRLRAHNVAGYQDYLRIVEADPAELNRLFASLTIKVSEFFREPEVFDRLSRLIDPRFTLSGAPLTSQGVRAWCCGCANGEEAYSLAMLLSERLAPGALGKTKIFATDIDNDALDNARRASYREEFARNVPIEARQRHFVSADGLLEVKDEIRGMVRFGRLDIVRDWPLSKMDIVFCRNLFIYFNKALQETVFKKLDYALKPGGMLVLGKAEVIPQSFSSGYESVGESIHIKR